MNKLAELTEAGFQSSMANDTERSVLKSLSEAEVSVLLSIRQQAGMTGSGLEDSDTPIPPGGWVW